MGDLTVQKRASLLLSSHTNNMFEDTANTVKQAVYWCILYVLCIMLHFAAKMDNALTP